MFTSNKTLALIIALAGIVMSAAPIQKTGPCPTLTRYTPTDVSWTTFPIEPSPTTTYPTNTVQNPLTPDQSINCLQVPVGLKAQLVASELTPGPLPSLGYIMNFTFDERGRVWAIEPRDYPYVHTLTTSAPLNSDKAAGGLGRIIILEDVDKDGSLDSYKVYYSGLVLPTSLELVNGGVIVTAPPNVYFLPRNLSNPDTTVGTPQIVVSGLGSTGNTYDTHGQTNSLTTGLDNWMYGHAGYNGCGSPVVTNGSTTGATGCTTGSIWRFKSSMIGSSANLIQTYALGGGGTNAHGIGQMEDGQFFSSRATVNIHSLHALRLGQTLVSTLATNSGNTADHVFYPLTRDLYLWEGSSSQQTNGFYSSQMSAVSGHDYYTSRLLPQKYWSRFSFQCEGATKLCNQDSMVVLGSTWRALRMPGPVNSNIFASTDAWTAPLKVRTGPDGGLWVLDWYNYLFLHNPAGPSQNAAWINQLRTKTRTRLYRIIPENGATEPVLNLTNATVAQLVSTLHNPNFLWRMQAQRLLIGKGYTPELGDSLQIILANHKTSDTVGIDGSVIHAIWTLEGLNRFTVDNTRWDPILKNLLLHPAWGVRENVLKAMPRTAASAQSISDQCAANDPHPHVRLNAYVTIAESPAASAPIQGAYGGTDTYSTSAFNAATAAKLVAATPANTRPATCPAIFGTVAISPSDKNLQPRHGLRFALNHGGFELGPHGQLASGTLEVYDLRGHTVFRSTYNAAKSEWSASTAKGLNMSVYLYSFRGVNGDKFDGRIFMSQDL